MKVRSQLLKARTAALLTGVTAIALSLPSGAFAADQNIVLKAPPVETGWEFHGWLEAGGIGFIQRPGSGFGRLPTDPFWLTPRTTESRATFEEYGRVPQGLYLDWINLTAA